MFSSREISRLAGFSKPWTLNHLEREDIFVPETPRSKHHGKHRNYTFRDLIVLRAINRLLKLGARPKRIRDAMLAFAEVCPKISSIDNHQTLQTEFARNAGHFIVSADSVLYAKSEKELVNLSLKGQFAFSFMLNNALCTLPSIQAACEVLALSRAARRSADAIEQIALKHKV